MTQEKVKYPKGKNPNSLKNLIKFKPGQSGNPKGHPSNKFSITAKQREMLPLPCPYSKRGETWLEWLADRGMALAGENPAYYRELMDRLEGKIPQPIGNEDGSPLVININVNSNNTRENIKDFVSRLSTN